jgi:hypothetical protein
LRYSSGRSSFEKPNRWLFVWQAKPLLTLHRDHLASVRAVTKMDGTGVPASGLPLTGGADIIEEQSRYAAFGEPKVVNLNSKITKGYIGERADPGEAGQQSIQ